LIPGGNNRFVTFHGVAKDQYPAVLTSDEQQDQTEITEENT
jgi:hypothetical protein